MGIQYSLTGDIKRAREVAVDATRQFFILRNAMKFQSLRQLQRIVTYIDGSKMVCSSVFGIETARVFGAPSPGLPVVVRKAEYCWCGNVFAEGVVIEVIRDYGNIGEIKIDDEFYPEYCKGPDSNIKNYTGIRYKVLVCQKTVRKEFICIPSDFAEYAEDDEVVVLFRGFWDDDTLNDPEYLTQWANCENSESITCQACSAVVREGRGGEADGSFLLIPAIGGSDE